MFSILLNTCAIPDGFVTYGESSKCSKCQSYSSQAVFYSASSVTTNISPSQIYKTENSSSHNNRLASSSLPDIIVSHSPTSVTQNQLGGSVSHLTDNERVRHPRERASLVSSRRHFQEESTISHGTSAGPINQITRKQCQSLCRGKNYRPDRIEERSGINPIELESIFQESCCIDGSSPSAVNQIDYVNVGFNLRLIADNFQSKSSTRPMTTKGSVVDKLNLPMHCYKYLSMGLLGFVVLLNIVRSL